MPEKGETGLFLVRSSNRYVVLWEGRQIASYENIEAFVDVHVEGLKALESSQADLISSFYKGL